MNKRLEMLSDKVRRGEPIGLSEALEVIDYQEQLKQSRKNNSWINKLRRFFGVKSEQTN